MSLGQDIAHTIKQRQTPLNVSHYSGKSLESRSQTRLTPSPDFNNSCHLSFTSRKSTELVTQSD